MATSSASIAAAGNEAITLIAEPGVVTPSAPGAAVNFVETVHAVGMTSILYQVFNSDNTAVNGWLVAPLDANGNATINASFTRSGQYLNVASPDTVVSTMTFPVTIAGAGSVAASVTQVANTPGAVITLTSAQNTWVQNSAPDTIIQTGGSQTVNSSSGSVTVNATAGGTLKVFENKGNDFILGGASTYFVGGPNAAASTIVGGANASDTVAVASPVIYDGSKAANLLYIGGNAATTLIGARTTLAFGGKGGGTIVEGSGGFLFTGGGGNVNVQETSNNAAAFIVGNNEQNLVISTVPGASSVKGASALVAFGNADTINAQNAAGGNIFYIVNQVPPAATGLATYAGNTTLVGSNAGHDGFAVFVDNTAPPAHTITIQNWQASDTMFISNLTAANGALGAADVQAIDSFLAPGGGTSLSLADGTTIQFVGVKPTAIGHN